MNLDVQWECWKGGHCREKLGHWGLGTNEWQGKWVKAVQRHQGEKFCQSCHGDSKLWVWFYFLSAIMAFMMHIGVWSILKLFVEKLIVLWIISCSVFCGCSYKNKKIGKGRIEEVSHMLCWFADHSFHCCRFW